jgi:hypothetical protein
VSDSSWQKRMSSRVRLTACSSTGSGVFEVMSRAGPFVRVSIGTMTLQCHLLLLRGMFEMYRYLRSQPYPETDRIQPRWIFRRLKTTSRRQSTVSCGWNLGFAEVIYRSNRNCRNDTSDVSTQGNDPLVRQTGRSLLLMLNMNSFQQRRKLHNSRLLQC